MAAKSYIPENRELAYRTWRACGQNVELTLKELKKKHGFPLSKPTLYDWIDKFNWKDRACRAENEEQRMKDAVANNEEKILADLEKQRLKYETYFDSLGDGIIDSNATYAYNSLAKTIVDIKIKMRGPDVRVDRPAIFMESMEFIAGYLKEHDPEGLKIIARNFDGIIGAFKERHA